MIKNKENILAFIVAIVDEIIFLWNKAPLNEFFTYIPLLLFAIIFYSNYLSKFPPNVWGERGRGTSTWYKNTYLVLSIKFPCWLLLVIVLLVSIIK